MALETVTVLVLSFCAISLSFTLANLDPPQTVYPKAPYGVALSLMVLVCLEHLNGVARHNVAFNVAKMRGIVGGELV